jgi:hypothetical protein|tara:strand:+ start:75 stop:764 length:690 start_codon:yes stop_codon:yes gene_type:complete
MAYPKAFMETLGQYVYAYYPEGVINGTPEYYGKGVDTRCLAHIKEKELDLANLFIMGRNLEEYAKSTDGIATGVDEIAAWAAEAALIAVLNPEHNKVSGRYGHLWVQSKLDDVYLDWKKEQINPVKESMRFYNEHPEIHDNVKGMSASGNSFTYYASTVGGIKYLLTIIPDVDGFKPVVKVEFDNKKREELRDEWVKNNQDEYKLAADGEMISVQDLSVEKAIELWTSQ